jgi:hypothetical protein
MSGRQLAQGVASLGRNGESMLVHMQPREVAGLQALAMQGGGSLTINPETGLPEAGWFGDILGAVAPIALGAFLGPAGLAMGGPGLSALQAGLVTGLGGFALSGGNLMKGLSAGLGGYGGAGIGESFSKFGATPLTTPVTSVAETSALGLPAGANAGVQLASPTTALSETLSGGLKFTPQVAQTGAQGLQGATSTALNAAKSAIPATGTMGQGAMNALKDPIGFFGKTGPGTMGNAFTLASPLMAIQPPAYKPPEDNSYQMKYEGAYTAQDRNPRLPTQAELTQLAAQGSPEYSYFGDSNPYPGFNKAPGYAQGGMALGGPANLYGSPDGTVAQNTLQEEYGLGRLNNLASAASSENAKEYGFDAGGTVPYMPGAPSYGIAPTDLSAVAAIPSTGGEAASSPRGLSSMLGNAITDPMGRTNTQGGMGGKGGNQNPMGTNIANGMGGKGGMMGMMGNLANKATTPSLTMQDYITAATRTYDPNASMAAAMDPTGAERAHFNVINPQPAKRAAAGGGLKDGGFVVPADVVSHLGNGSTDAGLSALQQRHGAQPIRGAGDGMSDSIKTTINGKQPARVADGEAYIPPEQVKRSGGAKKFYAMMDKVRKERTGTKKQGKQINPNKYMTA